MKNGEQCQNPKICLSPESTAVKAMVSAKNEVDCYTNEEPQMYVCSSASMPPNSSGTGCSFQSDGMSTCSGKSKEFQRSKKSLKTRSKSPGYAVDEKIEPYEEANRLNLNKDVLSEFKSQILNKFKEFAITPDTSFSELQDSLSSNDAVGKSSPEDSTTGGRTSEGDEDGFINTTKVVSREEKCRVPFDFLDEEVFSTGVSDTEEVVQKAPKLKTDDAYNCGETTKPDECGNKVVENTPTVQRSPVRLSLWTMKESPGVCLVDEIRKNNLLMEDIFTNTSSEGDAFHTDGSHRAGTYRSNNFDNSDKRASNHEKTETSTLNTLRANDEMRTALRPSNGSFSNVEIYETSDGSEEGSKNEECIPQYFEDLNQNGLLQHDLCKLRESLRLMEPPCNPERRFKDKLKPVCSPNIIQIESEPCEPSDPLARNTLPPQRWNEQNVQSKLTEINRYLKAKESGPYRTQEKYVKLMGLVDAFEKKDTDFKDILIKNSTSYESVNILAEVSRMDSNQISESSGGEFTSTMGQLLYTNKTFGTNNSDKDRASTKKKPETKDAATDFSPVLKTTKTQTSEFEKAMVTMVDCSVQCDSHIVDEANGQVNTVKNDHQEVMICNDEGDGVRLYSEMGHPLTDMNGYLLKDSLGQFLVRLDQYGVPISCWNGGTIYANESKPWDIVKNEISIVHQSKKKPFNRKATKRDRVRPSLRLIGQSMQDLRTTLEWAEKMSLGSIHKISLNTTDFYQRNQILPRNIEPTGLANLTNTNTLLAEMKSIARLRNTLLEKVNFMADKKNVFAKYSSNSKPRSTSWMDPEKLLQDDLNCPISRAVMKIKDTTTNLPHTLSHCGPTQNLKAIKQTGEILKNDGDSWSKHESEATENNENGPKGNYLNNVMQLMNTSTNHPTVENTSNCQDLWNFLDDDCVEGMAPEFIFGSAKDRCEELEEDFDNSIKDPDNSRSVNYKSCSHGTIEEN